MLSVLFYIHADKYLQGTKKKKKGIKPKVILLCFQKKKEVIGQFQPFDAKRIISGLKFPSFHSENHHFIEVSRELYGPALI